MTNLVQCRKLYLLVVSVFASGILQVHAQMTIRDVPVSTNIGGYVFVNGDVEYIGSQLIDNNGIIDITGNWYNSSITEGKAFTDTCFGEVKMSGDKQAFYGYMRSRFPSLSLEGTGDKTLNATIEVRNQLNLNDKVLDVNGNSVYVMSDNQQAIKYKDGQGYVKTTVSNEGWLVRNMNSGSEYIFPLGATDNQLSVKYRPLVLNAKYSGYVYSQFQNYDPKKDGYSTASFDKEVKYINPNFYHGVKSDTDGNAVIVEAYPFNSYNDGAYNTVSYWNPNDKIWQWTKSDGPFSTIYSTNDKALLGQHIQLSKDMRQPINLGILAQDTSVVMVPNVFTPNGDGVNDFLVFPGLDKYDENELVIFNRWNNNVYQSKNYKNDWAGADLNEGTYFYILKLKDKNGQWHMMKNYLLLTK